MTLSPSTSRSVSFAGVRVSNSAAESIPDSTHTALTFDTEVYDTDGFHDTGANTSRVTVPAGKAGHYLAGGSVEFESAGAGIGLLLLRVNGTDFISVNSSVKQSGVSLQLDVVSEYALIVGDYLELIAFQSAGGPINVDAANFYTPIFWAQFLG